MTRGNILYELANGDFSDIRGKSLLGGFLKVPGGPFAGAPLVGVPQVLTHRVFIDFVRPWDTNLWTINTVEAGAGTASEAVGDAQFGVLTLTNDDADDDADQIYYVNETFKLTSGNPLWFEARAKASAVTQIDIGVGLIAAEDLTAVADNMPADGVVFTCDDGDANIDFSSSKDGTDDTVHNIGTLDTGWHRYGFAFDGDSRIRFFLDGEPKGSVNTTLCDDEELSFQALVRNGDANARNLKIDYFCGIQLR